MNRAKGTNIRSSEVKRKKLIAKKEFTLADYIKSKIGDLETSKSTYKSSDIIKISHSHGNEQNRKRLDK
eukprot:2604012-Karenia_brevis.AAC.1